MWNDVIVDEARNAGRKLSDQCGNDLHKFSLMLKNGTEKSKSAGWKVVSKLDVAGILKP